jgi:hypothetical protein
MSSVVALVAASSPHEGQADRLHEPNKIFVNYLALTAPVLYVGQAVIQ